MNKILLAALALMMSTPAFAIHAYRSEVCKSTVGTHELVYKGNYPVGGPYALSKVGSGQEVELYGVEEGESANIVVVKAKTFNVKREGACKDNQSEGWDFMHEAWDSQKVIEFKNLTPDQEKASGLKNGTYMIFDCEETSDEPLNCAEVG